LTVRDVGTLKYLYISSLDLSAYTVTYSGNTVTTQHDYLAAFMGDGAGEMEGVSGIGEIDSVMDVQFGSGISAVSEMTLTFLNQGNFAGSNAYDIENMTVEVWEGHTPVSGTISITSDFLLRFKGRARNVGDYDYQTWRLSAVDRRFIDSRSLPARIINAADYPFSDPLMRGKPIPMIFGRLADSVDGTWWFTNHDFCPAYAYDSRILSFIAADHAAGYQGSVVFRTSSGISGELYSSASFTNNDTVGLVFDLTASGRGDLVNVKLYFKPSFLGFFQVGTPPFSGSTWRNAIDDDLTTYCAMSNTSGSTVTVGWAFDKISWDGVPQKTGGYHIRVVIESSGRSGTNQAWIGKRSSGTSDFLGNITSDSQTFTFDADSKTGWSTPNTNFSDYWDSELLVNVPHNGAINVKAIYMWVVSSVPNIGRGSATSLDVSSSGTQTRNLGTKRQGGILGITSQKYGVQEAPAPPWTSWYVNAAGIKFSSSMTSGRSHGYSTGDTVDNVAYVIEWILRNRLSLATADIDTASFDAVGNTTNGSRKGWKIAAVVNRMTDAIDLIRQIAAEFALVVLITDAGKYKLVALDTRTADYTITSADIFYQEGAGPGIRPQTTSNEAILNDIVLNYRVDYATNDAVERIYVSDIDGDGNVETNLAADSGAPDSGSYSSWIADSRDRYGAIKPYNMTLDFIRDAATAELLVKKLMDWHSFKRLVLEIDLVKNSNTLKLERGDVVLVNDDIITALHSNVTRFIVTRVNYPEMSVEGSSNVIQVQVQEVPNTNTGTPVSSSRWISSADLGVV
jgi:hypothetical protein